MAQAVSRQPLTVEAMFRAPGQPIFTGTRLTVVCFIPVIAVVVNITYEVRLILICDIILVANRARNANLEVLACFLKARQGYTFRKLKKIN
jgi:hypothetical protein